MCRWSWPAGPIGTLDAYARSERAWNESEVSALQACAGVVANLLGHAVAAWTQGRFIHSSPPSLVEAGRQYWAIARPACLLRIQHPAGQTAVGDGKPIAWSSTRSGTPWRTLSTEVLSRSGGGYDAPSSCWFRRGKQPWRLGRRFARATLADAPRLAQALASAFQDDPVIAWIFPDQHRRAVLPALDGLQPGLPPRPGLDDCRRGRRWLPRPGAGSCRARSGSGYCRLWSGSLLRTASVLGALERMEEQHPRDRSHWYLFIFGTEQAAQGQGLGSALLAQVLARVDADGMPAYLESSSERSLALYGRHGREVTSEVAILVPRIWPMWREPRPSTGDH